MRPILLLRGKALVPVGLSLAFSTLAHTTQSVRVEASDDIMGTTFSVVLYDSNRVKGEAAANAALAEAHRLDQKPGSIRPSSSGTGKLTLKASLILWGSPKITPDPEVLCTRETTGLMSGASSIPRGGARSMRW